MRPWSIFFFMSSAVALVAAGCGSSGGADGTGTGTGSEFDGGVGGGGDGTVVSPPGNPNPIPPDASFGDGAPGTTCKPRTCADAGANCGPIGDGCGGVLQCGTCSGLQTCGGGGVPSQCGGVSACVPKTCKDFGATCGPVGDGCGGVLQCGTCNAPETCGGGGTPSVCGGNSGCVPKTCAQAGANCGPIGDGCGGVLQCGTCNAPQSCGGGGTASQCGGGFTLPDGAPFDAGPTCTPKTCAQLGAACGLQGDGCGNTIDCGGCTAPATCGGGGVPSQCGGNSGCVAKTCAQAGANCGPVADGCGGVIQCGTCQSPQYCGGGGVPSQCGGVSTCTPKTCAQQGANCGPVADGCGGLLQCGTCTSPAICGGSGVPSVCGAGGPDGGLPDSGTCTGLCQQQVQCDGGVTTTLTGTVLDPAGKNPIYNAVVYVPNAPVQPFTQGVSCDQCGAEVSGKPIVSTITDYKGQFTLTNVPAGSKIPLVVQIGRWRRQTTLDVPACKTTPVSTQQTRLPRNKGEGDIPLMAISSGGADPMECLLLKIGIDAAEFTTPNGTGRVHYYTENGRDLDPSAGGPAPAGSALWSQQSTLNKYDIVYLPCEGNPDDHGNAARNRLTQYANVGGRVFTTHYSYAWSQPAWPTIGGWDVDQTFLSDNQSGYPATVTASVDQTFPKGQAFANWLKYVNASTTLARLPLYEARHDIDSVNNPPSQRWMFIDNLPLKNADGRTTNSTHSIQHLTFNTPINAGVNDAGASLACGRVVYSDFHVSASATVADQNVGFPLSCVKGDLSAQEKALEFMVFDLSSCIQNDTQPPAPPPTCTPRTCAQAGATCGPIGDGCGGVLQCGTCSPPQTCGGGGVPNQCGGGCVPRTCAQQGLSCGQAGDGCGNLIDCGQCAPPQTCGGGGQPGVCGAPSCTKITCQQQGIDCGPAGDGCGGVLQCGVCAAPQTCGGGGVPGKCGQPDGGYCVPITCQQQGIDCGPAGDGCGGILQCGVCAAPQTCGGGGQPGKCGAPSCTKRTCADAHANCGPIADGCGGVVQCGDCTPPASCGGGGTPNQCGAPSCTPRTCAQLGANCGPVADGCGGLLQCGECTLPQTCGGGGKANVCGGGIN